MYISGAVAIFMDMHIDEVLVAMDICTIEGAVVFMDMCTMVVMVVVFFSSQCDCLCS